MWTSQTHIRLFPVTAPNSQGTEGNSPKPIWRKSSLSFAQDYAEELKGPAHLSQAHLNLSWGWIFPPSSAGTLCSCLWCTFLPLQPCWPPLLHPKQVWNLQEWGKQPFPRGDLLALGFWGCWRPAGLCLGRGEQYLAAEPGAELRKNKGVMGFEVECDNVKGVFHQLKKIRYLFSKSRPGSNPGILIHTNKNMNTCTRFWSRHENKEIYQDCYLWALPWPSWWCHRCPAQGTWPPVLGCWVQSGLRVAEGWWIGIQMQVAHWIPGICHPYLSLWQGRAAVPTQSGFSLIHWNSWEIQEQDCNWQKSLEYFL